MASPRETVVAMNIACVQFDIAWEDKPANYARVAALLRDAKVPPGSLVLLPEMFATGFSMNVAAVAEEQGGATEQFLSSTARELGIFLLGGVVTRGANGLGRNECVVFSPESKPLARYCKMQPFTLGGETDHYEAGHEPIVLACDELQIAPFICYDLRFPEVARAVALKRPHLMSFIANWPNARLHHWPRLLQARAIENQCYIAGVNRIGNDPRYQHSGRSMIIDPHGEILADAGERECVIQARIDVPNLLNYRNAFPALNDMR
ncbi:MAG TPA: nitrilase-related carbon-nitrogen hydrolase, partial [Candidatus Acidoferrum sp.]|nr:nitrilase-related carbon-nitrogen hydrolase [Candidatus Acidoferrum sp.]